MVIALKFYHYRWGGCIVALCDGVYESEQYINFLKKTYYPNVAQAEGKNLDEIVFATSPQRGAEIYMTDAGQHFIE